MTKKKVHAEHINGNTLDCTRENLRIVNGEDRQEGKHAVRITKSGKTVYLADQIMGLPGSDEL